MQRTRLRQAMKQANLKTAADLFCALECAGYKGTLDGIENRLGGRTAWSFDEAVAVSNLVHCPLTPEYFSQQGGHYEQ